MADSSYKKAYKVIEASVYGLKEKPSFTHGSRSNLEATRNKRYPHVHLDTMTAVNVQTPDATTLIVRYNASLVVMVKDTVRDEQIDPVDKFDLVTDIAFRLQASLIQSDQVNLSSDIVTTPARFVTDDQATAMVLQFQLEVDAIPGCEDEGYIIAEYTPEQQEAPVEDDDIDGGTP